MRPASQAYTLLRRHRVRQDDDWVDPNGDSDNDGTKNKDDSDTGGGSSGGGEGGGSSGGGGGGGGNFTGTNPDLNPEGDNDDDGTLNKARRQQPSFKALCSTGPLA